MASLSHKFKSGQSMIELLLAMGLAAVVLPALFAGLYAARVGRPQTTQRLAASALMREATEAVRSIREAGWNFVATNGTWYPVISGSSWASASGTPPVINGYTRTVTVAEAYRDSSGHLAATGTPDPSTKLITVLVSWLTPYPSSVSSTFYLTRYRDNLAHIELVKVPVEEDWPLGPPSIILNSLAESPVMI